VSFGGKKQGINLIGGPALAPYTYDLCTTLVVQEAGGCLTKKNPAQCKAVLLKGEAVFVDFFHF
jgi:hypothetical protein